MVKKLPYNPLVAELEFAVAELDDDGFGLIHFAGDDGFGQLVEDEALEGSLDRPCAELRVVAFLGDIVDRVVRDAEVDTLVFEHLMDAADLQADDCLDIRLGEFGEVDDLIDTIDKLRPNLCAELLLREVGSHDNQGVLEVDQTTFVIRQTSVIEYLQQDVEDIGVRFLYLIEEDDRVGFTPDGFGQLSAFIVAHVSRRCTDESRGGELLLVLGHIDTISIRVIIFSSSKR